MLFSAPQHSLTHSAFHYLLSMIKLQQMQSLWLMLNHHHDLNDLMGSEWIFPFFLLWLTYCILNGKEKNWNNENPDVRDEVRLSSFYVKIRIGQELRTNTSTIYNQWRMEPVMFHHSRSLGIYIRLIQEVIIWIILNYNFITACPKINVRWENLGKTRVVLPVNLSHLIKSKCWWSNSHRKNKI